MRCHRELAERLNDLGLRSLGKLAMTNSFFVELVKNYPENSPMSKKTVIDQCPNCGSSKLRYDEEQAMCSVSLRNGHFSFPQQRRHH
ncbi:MAG: hypothetical protein R3B47_05940 [Bacteroidia bacterium]